MRNLPSVRFSISSHSANKHRVATIACSKSTAVSRRGRRFGHQQPGPQSTQRSPGRCAACGTVRRWSQHSPAVEEAAASLRPNLGRIAGLVGCLRRRTGQQSTTGRLADALFRTDSINSYYLWAESMVRKPSISCKASSRCSRQADGKFSPILVSISLHTVSALPRSSSAAAK